MSGNYGILGGLENNPATSKGLHADSTAAPAKMCGLFFASDNYRGEPRFLITLEAARKKVSDRSAHWVNRNKDVQLEYDIASTRRAESLKMGVRVMERASEDSLYHQNLAKAYPQKQRKGNDESATRT